MRHTFARAGVAVTVAVVAALALTGCSGSGDHNGQKQPSVGTSTTGQAPTASGSPPASPSPSPDASAPSASPVASGDPTQTVEGVWMATQGTVKVQLVLGKGKAALTSTHLCGGGYTDRDGIGLNLTCVDGDKERTTGHGVLAADGMTLTVQWTGGPTDTFSRTGLPSS